MTFSYRIRLHTLSKIILYSLLPHGGVDNQNIRIRGSISVIERHYCYTSLFTKSHLLSPGWFSDWLGLNRLQFLHFPISFWDNKSITTGSSSVDNVNLTCKRRDMVKTPRVNTSFKEQKHLSNPYTGFLIPKAIEVMIHIF